MANRMFEIYEYRQIIARMRLGDSDPRIAKAGLMGRKKTSKLREIALAQGWIEKEHPLPDDSILATVFHNTSQDRLL